MRFKTNVQRRVTLGDMCHAIALANSLRRFTKEAQIDDLPIGKRGAPECCPLAKAFNFSCSVHPVDQQRRKWVVNFTGSPEHVRKKIKLWADRNNLQSAGHLVWFLPDHIGRIAYWFDEGALEEYSDGHPVLQADTYIKYAAWKMMEAWNVNPWQKQKWAKYGLGW